MAKPTVPQILARALFKRLGRRPTLEYRVCKQRRWRADLAFVRQKVSIEVDGREHRRAANHKRDCEKRNFLTEKGWRCLTYPAQSVLTQKRLPLIVDQIERVLNGVHSPEDSAYVLSVEK